MYLGIDDEYQSTHFTENRVEVECRFKEVDLAWKVPYLKVDERTNSATPTKTPVMGDYFMLSLVILVVDSRNRVSFGCILWNTTRCIDDLPLL